MDIEIEKNIYDLIGSDDFQEAHELYLSQNNSGNLFQITGMGSREIKHSRVLGWIFGGSNNVYKKYYFKEYLKGLIGKYSSDELRSNLRDFVYLKEPEVDVLYEYANIDILLVDHANKYLFVIENKIGIDEHGNQLSNYREFIEGHYPVEYKKFGIFLTVDGHPPKDSKDREFYVPCSYEEVGKSIVKVLRTKRLTDSIPVKEKLLVEDYLDHLRMEGIVEDKLGTEKQLNELYGKVLTKYGDTLDAIFEYREKLTPRILNMVYEKLVDKLGVILNNDQELGLVKHSADQYYLTKENTWKGCLWIGVEAIRIDNEKNVKGQLYVYFDSGRMKINGYDLDKNKELVKNLLKLDRTASQVYVLKTPMHEFMDRDVFIDTVHQWMKENSDQLRSLDSLIELEK